MDKGASPAGDRATAVEPVPVSPLRDGIPSAEDIRKVADLFDPKSFEPHIKRATDEIYSLILASCEDYLRENIDYNIGSYVAMLERENQRMRTELFEVDRALGCMSLGHQTRLDAIAETQERYRQSSAKVWELSGLLAQGIEARSGETAQQARSGTDESPVGNADAPDESPSS